jgi:hypothetical protein
MDGQSSITEQSDSGTSNEKELQNRSRDISTSRSPEEKNPSKPAESDGAANETAEEALADYPSGLRLLLIIVALCLAIFLTSLDMVSLLI